MNLDVESASLERVAPVALAVQFINIDITPIVGGRFSVAIQATLLDEKELQFVGQDLGHEYVDSLDDALATIRKNVGVLAIPAAAEARP
jgi:hypothetical protein